MFFRKIQQKSQTNRAELNSLHSIILFILILVTAILFSSLTSSEVSPCTLLDSLNTNQMIYFDFASSELKIECFYILDKLADEMKSSPDLKVLLTGHTDNIGSEDFNIDLSVKRAFSVKEYLVSNGCNPENILVEGKGKSEPLNENLTDYDRAFNRRVEFSFINQKTKPEEKDVTYLNSTLKQVSKNELQGDLSVRDTTGEPEEGIKEEDVQATLKWDSENKKDSAQGTVRFISIDEKKKIAFTFVMDYSPSMYDDNFSLDAPKTQKILSMEKAVQTFITDMDSKHLARIIKFGKAIDLVRPYTRTKELLSKAITEKCYPRTGTALFRVVYTALSDTIYNCNPTIMKTVIALSDGEENSSGNINKDSIYRISESRGIKVYTVGLLEEYKHSIPFGFNGVGEADLFEIAARTGGFYWWANKPSDLPIIYSTILKQIMKSYQVSILWTGENLPPKGTNVTAVVRVNVKGRIRTIYKDYVME